MATRPARIAARIAVSESSAASITIVGLPTAEGTSGASEGSWLSLPPTPVMRRL